jgi:hypothetical protein
VLENKDAVIKSLDDEDSNIEIESLFLVNGYDLREQCGEDI